MSSVGCNELNLLYLLYIYKNSSRFCKYIQATWKNMVWLFIKYSSQEKLYSASMILPRD